MSELNIQSVEESEIDTILAEDIDFTGKLSFAEPLMIKGKFNGKIESSSDLYIGENAVVKAEIESSLVSLKGKLKGNIKAKKMVELFSTAEVIGDITTTQMVMESGCTFNGLCSMEKNNEGTDREDSAT